MLQYIILASTLAAVIAAALVCFKLLDLKNELNLSKVEFLGANKAVKEEVLSTLSTLINAISTSNKESLEVFSNQLMQLTKLNEQKLEAIRNTLEDRIYKLQSDNNEKLEKMRSTVEEKLQDTLEKRLSDSFKIVSDRLEQVHKGLGEMQTLALGVGDLKKVLTNVKTRGTWGEVQLDILIEQILTVEQYEKNVAVQPNTQDRIEFAIKLPNKDDDKTHIWLPIDAKFPMEDYQRLVAAYEKGDLAEIEENSKLLDQTIKKAAKLISEKYIAPPFTTDFAIMFLPVEALYAEVLRRPGLIEFLQKEYRVIITSPTTILAIMNSLQMGFRTLAIQKRSSEVWKVLATVKSEFVKFAGILDKTKQKLDQASKVIGDAETRTRVIQRHLKNVESLNAPENDNQLEELSLINEQD
jgi:DNA recombination protein RmuC